MHVKTSKLALISHMMPSSVLTVVDGGGRAVETAGIKATLYKLYSTVLCSPPRSRIVRLSRERMRTLPHYRFKNPFVGNYENLCCMKMPRCLLQRGISCHRAGGEGGDSRNTGVRGGWKRFPFHMVSCCCFRYSHRHGWAVCPFFVTHMARLVLLPLSSRPG